MPDRRPPPGNRWLDRCTELLADGVAPAMPWLFLTLRRALIPTVCLIVLAVLFYGVPQSSEVLLGLIEPNPEGLAPGSALAAVNIYPLTWYVIWSILLAVAIWYSACLLCTVEAWLGMPLAWEILNLGPHMRRPGKHRTPSGLATEMRVVKAIKWLPRSPPRWAR
ncbi:hypothetical protein [Candidatus Burkholderia verschuerenii]|uniref:hypothetical protein n=1 Tax=Candidatus Burkholderia verschuerenii TaxID=242163 RepID=UPI00067CB2FB|nr:hypothetical protein [Candidatus Burkholderia verschuerenii]